MISLWRGRRAELALKKKGAMALAGHVNMLFHVIPEAAFAHRELRDTWRIAEQEVSFIYVQHKISGYRYNADGFIGFSTVGNEDKAYGYTQLFRSGIVEYADSHCFCPLPHDTSKFGIYGLELERQMIQCYKDAISRIRKEGRTEGVYISFSLTGIESKSFYIGLRNAFMGQSPSLQDVFISPEVFVDPNEPDEYPYPKTLLPLIDTMWQLAGIAETPFKANGVWQPWQEWR